MTPQLTADDLNKTLERIERLRWWLAGVDSDAAWYALQDTIVQNYVRHRSGFDSAFNALRAIGIVNSDALHILADVETARRSFAYEMRRGTVFKPLKWEAEFNRNHTNDDE